MRKLLLIAAFGLTCSYNTTAQIQLVSTLAGQTTSGTANGTGTVASFNEPTGICVDASGNVYVADRNNHLVRKITPAGVVTTIAGSGSTGSVNATGTAASFWYPTDVCVDGSGNVYVCDSYNNKIRMISSTGVVSDFAGSGAPGSADGPGSLATFVNPAGIGLDAGGNIYVADYGNQLIRKISPSGGVTTVAGSGTVGAVNGTGTQSSFNLPGDVCADLFGNIFVADVGNHCIRKINSSGVVSTFAGTMGSSGYVDATGTAAKFDTPYSVSCNISGEVFVADFSNHKIRKISSAGVVTTLAGLGTGYLDGNNTVALFSRPIGIAVFPSSTIYTSDRDNNMIRKIEPCMTPPPTNVTATSTVCSGHTLTLSATSTGTVSWFNTATNGSAFATGSTFVTSGSQTAGNYTLYAEAVSSCTTSATRTPITYTIIDCCVAPTAPVNTNTGSAVAGSTMIPVGGIAILTASAVAGTISWFNVSTGGTSLGTGTSFTTATLPVGTYTFYAEALTCTVSPRTPFIVKAYIPEGISKQANVLAKNLYPNPNNGAFTLELNNSDVKTITIVDLTGRTLFTNTTSDVSVDVNLKAFANGIYYVKVQSGSKTEVLKVVKQ